MSRVYNARMIIRKGNLCASILKINEKMILFPMINYAVLISFICLLAHFLLEDARGL